METILVRFCHHYYSYFPSKLLLTTRQNSTLFNQNTTVYYPEKSNRRNPFLLSTNKIKRLLKRTEATPSGRVPIPPLDLTEENVRQVMDDARIELAQLFDTSVGITGEVELADLDGPFVKIRLRGRFWHKRSTVVARLANYLKQRIPEILEVDIEEEKQLDDSPENF